MLETERHDREPDNDGPAGAGPRGMPRQAPPLRGAGPRARRTRTTMARRAARPAARRNAGGEVAGAMPGAAPPATTALGRRRSRTRTRGRATGTSRPGRADGHQPTPTRRLATAAPGATGKLAAIPPGPPPGPARAGSG